MKCVCILCIQGRFFPQLANQHFAAIICPEFLFSGFYDVMFDHNQRSLLFAVCAFLPALFTPGNPLRNILPNTLLLLCVFVVNSHFCLSFMIELHERQPRFYSSGLSHLYVSFCRGNFLLLKAPI